MGLFEHASEHAKSDAKSDESIEEEKVMNRLSQSMTLLIKEDL